MKTLNYCVYVNGDRTFMPGIFLSETVSEKKHPWLQANFSFFGKKTVFFAVFVDKQNFFHILSTVIGNLALIYQKYLW